MQEQKILILGGGFGGIIAARELAKKHIAGAKILLISNKDYFEYYPALYRVVTGSSPIEVCVPLEEVLPKAVEFDTDTITSINLNKKVAVGQSGSEYKYDTLVLALGSQTAYFDLPGIENFSLGFKSVNEALRLKKHIHSLFEMHENPNPADCISNFRIVIVGGGPSGVEVAGDLSRYMQKLAYAHKVDPSFITIDIIEGDARLIPSLPPKVSAKILMRLRQLGINVFLNRFLMKEEVAEVYMKDMSIKSNTVIWTAGTKINPLISSTAGLLFAKNKRVEVDEYMQAKNFTDVFVIGDAAATQYSGLAQTAIYDGKYVAEVISRKAKNKKLKKYIPKKNNFAIPIGRHWGVVVMGPFHIYGFMAYLMRHVADFLFFSKILSVQKLFSLFFEGWKYRKVE